MHRVVNGVSGRGLGASDAGGRGRRRATHSTGLGDAARHGEVRGRTRHLALLAEAYGQAGQPEAGLQALEQALKQVAATEERWWEAELYRLHGDLLLHLPSANVSQAEASFHQALGVARRQQAKALELRAAISLSRLWQRQGKCEEAHHLLAEIYRWFTEGFDTADLQTAKALLGKLA